MINIEIFRLKLAQWADKIKNLSLNRITLIILITVPLFLIGAAVYFTIKNFPVRVKEETESEPPLPIPDSSKNPVQVVKHCYDSHQSFYKTPVKIANKNIC